MGSSSISSRGEPISACAIPSRCCMPFDIAPTLVAAGVARARPSSSSSARSPAPPSGVRQALVKLEQLVGAEPVGKPEQLGQVADAAARLQRSRRRAEHLDLATGRAHQPAGDLHQRGLARPVGPQQAHELARLHAQVGPGEGGGPAVGLVQTGRGQDGWHRAECRQAAVAVCPGGPVRRRPAELRGDRRQRALGVDRPRRPAAGGARPRARSGPGASTCSRARPRRWRCSRSPSTRSTSARAGFPPCASGPGCSGYRTVAAALTEHARAQGPWSAAAAARARRRHRGSRRSARTPATS